MPNKTIYVSDDDLPLFQRAQQLVGGNLSGAIVAALRRFIELEESKQAGYDEVVVRVGPEGTRKVRFVGRQLAHWNRTTKKGRIEIYQVYQGRSGKFAVHIQIADWEKYEDTGNWLQDMGGWRGMIGLGGPPEWGDYRLEIVDSLDKVRDLVPDKVYRVVLDAVDHSQVEDLEF